MIFSKSHRFSGKIATDSPYIQKRGAYFEIYTYKTDNSAFVLCCPFLFDSRYYQHGADIIDTQGKCKNKYGSALREKRARAERYAQ